MMVLEGMTGPGGGGQGAGGDCGGIRGGWTR